MKVIVFLAEGFEEVEALTVVDYLRRVGIEVDTVSLAGESVVGAHGIEVISDKEISEIEVKDYDGIIIPGGMPGASNLRDNPLVIQAVKNLDLEGKLLGAICAGPIVLAEANIIDGERLTSFPGFEEELEAGEYCEDGVVVSNNIITARGPFYAVDFAIEIVNYLLGEAKAEELKESILYKKF